MREAEGSTLETVGVQFDDGDIERSIMLSCDDEVAAATARLLGGKLVATCAILPTTSVFCSSA
jgi:hypothetical protein